VAGFIVTGLFALFGPSSLSNGSTSAVAFVVITGPVFFYAGYWAFNIRRALRIHLYRRQAFGVGVITLALWSTVGIYGALQSVLSLQVFSAVSNLTWYFLWLTLFYWVDASVLASRRSDPLLRDTLYWSKLRTPLWTVDLIAVGVTFSLLGYAEISGNVALLNQVAFGNFDNAILNFVQGLPVVLGLVCGVVYLSATAARSKWDRTLRRHFAWFALFLLLTLGILGPLSFLFGPVSFLLAGFALYRSAKSLVPLNRVSLSALEYDPEQSNVEVAPT
jgi:hypothetical protein